MHRFTTRNLIVFFVAFVLTVPAHATVTLTTASGGSAILSNTAGGAWTALTGPELSEGATADIGTGTLVLTVPSGFQFDSGGTAPTVLITRTSGSGGSSRNINGVTSGTPVAVTGWTSNAITFTVTSTTSNGVTNSLTWQNIRVRPIADNPLASGNIVRSGTATVNGLATTNYGALQEVHPLPTTTSISPNTKATGDPGFTMTVNGTNFVSVSQVQLEGANRATTYVSGTELSVAILTSDMTTAGTFNITVVNASPGGGASNPQAFTVTGSAPVPTTTSISPSTKAVGDPGFAMTVNGTNFVAGSVVNFAGSPRATAYVSTTQLTATIPASDMSSAGTFAITVFNPAPGGGTSNSQTFTVTLAPPSAITNAASSITASGATLNGTVSSNGASTTVTFDYGLTTSYGTSAGAVESPLAPGASGAAVTAAATGLSCSNLYHFRVVATSANGTTYGLDSTFTTSACTGVILTPAMGGAAILSNTAGVAWTTLTGPVLSEQATADIGTGTIVLTLPSGFVFDTGGVAPTVLVTRTAGSGNNSRNINGVASGTAVAATSMTSSTITFTVTNSTSNSVTNSLTWQNIRVRPAVDSPLASGNISRSGTATLNGLVTTNFGVLQEVHPVPTTTGISPDAKAVGDAGFTMTVNGTSFVSVSQVQINGASRSTSYVNGTQLTALILASDMATAGTYAITVVNPATGGGTSNAQTFTVTTPNPVPTTTSISPNNKVVGDSAFNMTVNGTNFVASSIVHLDGSPRATTYVSPTILVASILASDMSTAGTYAITAVNPAPGGGTSNSQTFTVLVPPPAVTTGAAAGVTSTAATVNGTVSSNGADTTVTFEYGLTTSYTESILATESPLASAATNAAVSAELAGLNCSTLFHYRVVATNSTGTTNGSDGTFTTGACAAPFPATACAASRYNGDLGCTAQDVSLTTITLAPGSISACDAGQLVTLDLDLTVNFASPTRYDVGIFIANDGKLPTLLPSSGGASSCSVDVLPITPPPVGFTFPDVDGVPQGTADTCGDGDGTINGGTGSGSKRMTGVTLPCYASPYSAGKLYVPFAVSWDNQRSPVGGLCTSNQYPVPSTSSKCNAPLGDVAIDVVVKPKITKTDSRTTINPAASNSYTVQIFNDSGGTLLDMVFTDPAIGNFTVNSVSCTPSGGAICPTTTIALMQGSGIVIPSADLPNNGMLTFTIDGTVDAGAVPGDHVINTATVTVTGGYASSATDDDVVVNDPAVNKSFSPASIAENAASTLTITLSNPTVAAITNVTFTDSYPSGLVNATPASGATNCGGVLSAINGAGSLTLTAGTIPATGTCIVTVYVTSAAAGTYVNNTGDISSSWGTISGGGATLTVTTPDFGRFNACDDAADPNALCTNVTTLTQSHITTKIAGTAFGLDLVALNTDGSWNSSYSNDVIVELLDASDNSAALDANNCRSSWTVIATLPSNPSFAGSNGQISLGGTFTVADAYRNVRVRVQNNSGATRIGCSTDNFAIRPASLVVTATDTDWVSAGAARTLDNTAVSPRGSSTSTPPIHKAGWHFTVSASARNSSSVTTANYTGTPTLTISDCSPAGTACTSNLGTFALNNVSTFSAGLMTSAVATYTEVGAFNLMLQDTTFAAVDGVDTPASCAGRYVCSAATPVGRFVPDHFELSGTITPADSSGGFSYMDEPFSMTFTLVAKNAASDTTVNYADSLSLAKLDPSTAEWLPAYLAVDFSFGLGAKDAAADLSSRLALSGTPSGTWVAGTATVVAGLTFSRPSTPTEDSTWGPYETLEIGVYPQDDEGITLEASALDFDVNGDMTNERRKMAASTRLRFGRLRLVSGQASGLSDYSLAVETQYWSGAAWITNGDDSHTTFAVDNVSESWVAGVPAGTSPTVLSISPVENGFGYIELSSPDGQGTATLCLDLGTTTTDCAATAPAGLEFLGGNWAGSTFDFEPYAEIQFGRPRPDSLAPWGVIYERENY